ncbi:sugar phosphate isomerase/epimerase family protein [Bacillus alkalicellulosilyticus]|uniref:sugar phosphate isomerase/epimerase family protein n=1 Tax=Alkalihalobacterium alkalicellulosilyticum TaxID=1912214 RepID=UPI0009979316|nr:sugar phosphate isomerase/epimerase family protein [Bacillus alkalicellulosilyticus]
MSQYGISTFAVFHLPLEEGVKEIVERGWKHLEFMCEGPGEELLEWSPSKLIEIRDYLQYHGATTSIHAPITRINLASSDVAVREESIALLRQCFQIADVFESQYVLSHLGVGEDRKESLRHCVESIQTIIKEKYTSDFYIENVPPVERLLGGDVSDLIFVLELVRHEKLGVVFDTGHANMKQKLSPIEQFQLIGEHTKVVHVSNNYELEDEHLPAGEGCFPWRPWNELAKIKGIDPLYIMENKTINDAEKSKRWLADLEVSRLS